MGGAGVDAIITAILVAWIIGIPGLREIWITIYAIFNEDWEKIYGDKE